MKEWYPIGPLGGYDSKEASEETSFYAQRELFPDVVQQQFKDEVDINTIVRRFGMTQLRPSGVDGGIYGDFTGVDDFESAVAAVARARDGFMKLPPDVRERFDNDPGRLLGYLEHAGPAEVESVFGKPAADSPSEGSGSPAP